MPAAGSGPPLQQRSGLPEIRRVVALVESCVAVAQASVSVDPAQPGPDRALRVVLVGLGEAEMDEQAVPHVAGDEPPHCAKGFATADRCAAISCL